MEKRVGRPAAEKWYEQCGKKKRYSSREMAKSVAARRMGEGHVGSPALSVYRCDLCSGYHITSKPWYKKSSSPGDGNGSGSAALD